MHKNNMKIISYNVSWCKQEKIDWLIGHQDVDAFVIPECGNQDNIQVPEGVKFFWWEIMQQRDLE